MVADSITDSQLSRGSPISRDDFKKRKANLLRKLNLDDARRSQWIDHQCEEEEDETGLSAATASSPTGVVKNKDSDCFCCSKQLTEEEEAFVDANDNASDDYSDAMRMFEEEEGPSQSDHNKSTTCTAKPEEPSADDQKKKEEDVWCPLCAEKMDKTDLRFKPCSSCEFKMCLFCVKKINESTGVCPGCRKKYEKQTTSNNGEVTFQQRCGDPLPLSSSFQGLDSD